MDMTNSLQDILAKRQWEEPPEVQVIKEFVYQQFQTVPKVTIQSQQIIIQVPNAALAGSLRPHLHELHKLCRTDKRLMIRIGR